MRPEKELLKKEVTDKLARYKSFVLMHYLGFSANAANNFRRQIKTSGGDVEVVRKRILLKAATDAGLELDQLALEGHIGIVFLGEDPITTTKIIFDFSKEKDKTIQVIGGQFEGKMYSGEDVKRLSTLPGKDEMRAQLLATFEAPLSQTLAVMEALLTSVPYCLDNKVKLENGDVESGDEATENTDEN